MADLPRPYRVAVRPTLPDSFPRHVDQELRNISETLGDIRRALEAIHIRLDDLETP
jgi:hypothetical protein